MALSDLFKRRRPEAAESEALSAAPPLVDAPARPPEADNALPRFHDRASGPSRRSNRNPIRIKMRTAFTPAQPVSNVSMFAGRRDTLIKLIRAIEDQQVHVVLYGDRGIGKTSILHVVGYLAREAGYLVRYISCSETSEFDETFRRIASGIPQVYHTDIDPTSEQVENGDTLGDLLPPGTVSVAHVGELFAKLTGTRFVIILDEFDRSDPAHFRRQVAELIKTLSDQSTRVQLVIAGVAGNLTELIRHIPSIRRNVVGLPVPNMSEDEVRELIHIGSRACGLPFGDEAIRVIVRMANGSPYLASLLAQHAGVAALDRKSARVDHADVLVALDRSLAEVEQRVSAKCLYNFSKITDSKMLAVLTEVARLALTSGGHIPEAPASDGADPESYRAALDALENRFDILRPTPDAPGGGFEFCEEGAALYFWLCSALPAGPAIKRQRGAAA